MEKIKVLFVCEHNGARSQMAEAFLNKLAGEKFEAHSAGLERWNYYEIFYYYTCIK